MTETSNGVLDTQKEAQEQTQNENKAMSYDGGIIKVNLNELNKPTENAIPEQEANASDVIIEQPKGSAGSESLVEEIQSSLESNEQPIQNEEESLIEEITKEQVQQKVESLEEQLDQAIDNNQESGTVLPENIKKVVDFMNETGGSLEDYVKLNTDYASLNEDQLLREYYETTKPHLNKEEIDFLMEDNFAYDE